MHSTIFAVTAILAYLAAAASIYQSLRTDYLSALETRRQKGATLVFGFLAVGCHALTLSTLFDAEGDLNIGFLNTLSAAAWMIATVLLAVTFFRPVEKLGIVVFPMAALGLALKLSFPESTHFLKNHSLEMRLHVVVSMLAYSFLNIAALQAIVLAVQDWRLKTHHASGFVRSLPPLQTMEKLLFQLIGAGFVLLSVSLVTGFLFVEDLFGQHLAHKTVLSIAAWGVFAALLGGRRFRGWRGRTAIRWTLGGFAALMLAYFGSKMVLELVLHRI
ncbi:cytochrome C assembly family protein [Methylococcus capsulatus]|uniref:cytochrome C assembly family protein n=1 Tax=Methylococcus capsulatus TaxID=414 RepID=UPI0002ED488D|nr:cytochrome c biogenesis protein CcsA [Methylococcus capsulatus]